MNKNKKIIILSSSLAGVGLAAGALAASCNDSVKATTADLQNEGKNIQITAVPVVNSGTDYTDQFIVNYGPKTGKLNSNYKYDVQSTVRGEYDQEKSAYNYTAKVLISADNSDGTKVSAVVDVPFMGPTFDQNSPYNPLNLKSAKVDAIQKISEMPALSDTEKKAFVLEINQASSTTAIDAIMEKAKLVANEDANKIDSLNSAKTDAKTKLSKLTYLSDGDKADFNGKISQAQTIDAVETVLLNAEALNRSEKAKADAQKAKDEAEAKAQKAKDDLKQTLMDSTGVEIIYTGSDKANTYLPMALSTTKGKLDVKNDLLASVSDQLDEIANFAITSVEVMDTAKDVLVVHYRLQSKIDPSVSASKTYTINGFETEEKYNEMMASQFSKDFDAAVAKIQAEVEFDYTSKETTKTTQATKENVVVTNGEMAPAMVQVESVAPQDANDYKNTNVVVTYKIVSTNEMYPLSTEAMEVVVSGFADNTAEHVANYNLVRNAATDLKLVPVTQSAENTSAASTAAEAYKKYNQSHAYMDIFTMNYLQNDGKDYVFADNSTRDNTQKYEGIAKTYEGVDIKVLNVYMLATHPNVLLVDLSLTKDGTTANVTKMVMGYSKYVATEKPAPVKPADPVQTQTEKERLAALTVTAIPHYSATAGETKPYYVQKTFDQITKDIQVLPSTFVTEYNNEVANYNKTEENGYNYAADSSILNLALEATDADAKVVGADLVANDANGTITLTVTLESTKPEYAGTTATVATTFDHKFMTTAIADAILELTGKEMNKYTLPSSVKENDNTVVEFVKDGMNAAPITDKSVFAGPDAADYYKYFQLRKDIKFVSQVQDGTETTVDGTEVYDKVNEDETINKLVKAQDSTQTSLNLTQLGLKYRATYVKPDYETTQDDPSDVYVTNRVAIDVPGLGDEAQYVLGGLNRKQVVAGFLYPEKIKELYNLWIANSGAFLNQTDTANRKISYFVNGKDAKDTTSVSEASANTPENKAKWEFANATGEKQTGILYPESITLANGTTAKIKTDGKYTDPYYVNFGYKLDVQKLSPNLNNPSGINMEFKVKSPYNDWVSLEDQNTLVEGFQSDLANAEAKFKKLRDLLEMDLKGDHKLISVDYIDPANPDAKEMTPVDTAVNDTHKKFFTVLWNKGITPEYFNKVVQEYAEANPTDNYDMLLDYDYPTVEFTLDSASVQDASTGVAAVVFTPSRQKEINGKDTTLTADKFTAANVPGFLLTKEQEKVRLNTLKAQLQYMPAGYVSTAKDDNSATPTEDGADYVASFNALREIPVASVTDASMFSAIANYVPEHAKLVVDSVKAAADTDINRDVTVTVHFVSTSKGLTDVTSDNFVVTFGGFKTKAEVTKEQRQAEIDALNVTYAYEVPANTPNADELAADKVTPNTVSTDSKFKPYFVPSMDQEAQDSKNVTITLDSIELPTFENNYDKVMNDKVVLTYTIADKTDSTISVERKVQIPGFLTAFAAETAKLEDAAKAVKTDSSKLTLNDLSNAGQFLPSVAKAVLFNPAYYAEGDTKPNLSVADSSADYKVADVVNKETFENSKFVADNAKGTLAIPFKLVSTNPDFAGLKDANGNAVVPWAAGVYTSDVFMKQAEYDPMYTAEVERLNAIAAKTALTKGNAIGLTIPGIMKRPTVNDVLENKNNIWDDFALLNSVTLLTSNGTFSAMPQPTDSTSDTNITAKAKVRVVSAEKGFKPNSVILTFRLVSNDASKEGMMDYSKVSEYSGVTSDQYTSETILYNFQSEDFKNSYLALIAQKYADGLMQTGKDWMDDTNLTQESRNLMKAVKQPVNYYNNTFYEGVQNGNYVLDEILKPDSTLEVKLNLTGKDGKVHSPSDTDMMYDLTWKEVADTDSLAFAMDSNDPLSQALEAEGYYIKSSRVVNKDLSDYLGNYNNSTDLYAVITLGNKIADAAGIEATSPEFLVKVSNLLSPAEKQAQINAERVSKIKYLGEASYVANTSNVVLTDEGKTQISSAVLADNDKLASLLKVSLLGTAHLNNADVWNNPTEVQTQYNVNEWANVNKLTDKDAKDAYVKAHTSKLQLPGLLSTIHNKVNSFLNDESDYPKVLFTKTKDNVNFVIDGTEILSEDSFQISFIVNYTVQILDENYNVVQSIPTRTMFLNVEKADAVETDKQFKAALDAATATFTADETDLTDVQEVTKYDEKTPNISLAEINLPAEYAQYKDMLTVEIKEVSNDANYDGRVFVKYVIVPKDKTGHYASSLFTAKAVEKTGWVSGYEYNKDDAALSSITMEKAPEAPAASSTSAASSTAPAEQPAAGNSSASSN